MPIQEQPSRRAVLKHALAAGGLGLGATYASMVSGQPSATPTPACRDGDEPTEEQIEGPFFKPRSPQRAELVEPGTRGRIFQLEGQVLTRSCHPIAGVLLDLWHADEAGDYDNSGFRYRGHLFSDAAGRYRFRTIMPGLYPGRTRHYHFKVQAPRQSVLTTQTYFPGEARNQIDDFFSPEMLMRVSNGSPASSARFDFILDVA
jgi:protocatechuate 3,4-dioxygenase beta subunit